MLKTIVQYSWQRILLRTVFITILAFISFWLAWAVEEGSSKNDLLLLIAKSVYIFIFPTHIIFDKYMDLTMFIVGILLNAIFYSLIIETFVVIFRQYKSRRGSSTL